MICSYAVSLANAHLIVVTASFPGRMTSFRNCAVVIFFLSANLLELCCASVRRLTMQ